MSFKVKRCRGDHGHEQAIDEITYLVAGHYSLTAIFSVVFCVFLYVASKLSLSYVVAEVIKFSV